MTPAGEGAVNQAEALFRAGQLSEAVAAQAAAVRGAPNDIGKRWFLAELLCFADERERADRMLDVIASQSADHQLNLIVFRQLLRGEEIRRHVLLEGRAPELASPAGIGLRDNIEALLLIRLGRGAEASACLDAAAQRSQPVAGLRNGAPFDEFRDLDDVFAPLIELITAGGEYRWAAVAEIARLELLPLARPRDLIWRAARIELRGGQSGEVWLPCIYVPDAATPDDELRLGRRTDWTGDAASPVRGAGLRSFLIGDEDVPIHELGNIEFAAAEVSA